MRTAVDYFLIALDWVWARIPQSENPFDFTVSEAAHEAKKRLNGEQK